MEKEKELKAAVEAQLAHTEDAEIENEIKKLKLEIARNHALEALEYLEGLDR